MPSRRTSGSVDLEGLIDALERAGLHGHGGAFFPTATKLRAVAAQRRRPIVVVNGSEGEPLSRKDRFLLTVRTDLVLDGALTVAEALGAGSVIIAIDRQRIKAIDAVELALVQRPDRQRRRGPTVEVVEVPPGFVTGQETALLNYLGGGEAKPTATPPYPFEKGLHGRPTLVSNVETFAQIARVCSGTFDGSRFVTVSGAVARSGVVQTTARTTVRDAVVAAGGTTEPLSGVLLGGYGGMWAAASAALDLALEESALRAGGLTLGAGIVHVLGQSQCPVAEVARVVRWMAGQTAGQCGPCVFGLDAIAAGLESLCGLGARGGSESTSLAQIQRWCTMVTKRGGCAHPDGVARHVRSALTVFSDDFEDHAAHGPCEHCDRVVRRPPDSQPALRRRDSRSRARVTV